MRWSEIMDLTEAWAETPPAHVAVVQLRDIVISAFGGRSPSKRRAPSQTPDQLAAALGLEAADG